MRFKIACLACLLLLMACTGCGAAGGSVPGPEPARPYHTRTPTRTATIIPAETEILLPTPTILLYTVVLNDTLGAIAERFDVSLEALMAANPGVEPTALIVGMELVIPIGNSLPSEPTPTAVPVTVRQAACWPEAGGGLWCFALFGNDYAETLENIAAQFTLLDESGNELGSQIAYAPLDILPPGASMPVGVHFPPPADPQAVPRVQLLTAIRILPGDNRYLPVMLENTLVSLQAGGRSARVTGRAMLVTLDGYASVLWILAAAYDGSGNLVGFRRWEAPAVLRGGESVGFDFLVSSLGPSIERVEFLTEARP